MSTIQKGTLFPAELTKDVFSKVKGKSSIAKLVASDPIPFNGTDVFTFDVDGKVSIVGEGGAKPAGGASVASVQIRPIKVVYQSRVSDEFLTADEEAQLNTLAKYGDAMSKKFSEAVDEMMMHGVNPASGEASDTIGNNHFDYVITLNSGANKITYTEGTDAADEKLEDALDKLDGDATSMVFAPAFRKAMANIKANGIAQYPEFKFDGCPESFAGKGIDVNKTVSVNSSKDLAFCFDAEAIKWGYAKDVTLEVIEYGDPDGTGKDLKQYNEVLLRSEAFIGWGFLDNSKISAIVAP